MSAHQGGRGGVRQKPKVDKCGQGEWGWLAKCGGQAWTGGGLKDPQICADILYGWPLILKIPKPPNNFEMESVHNYKKYNLKEKLIFANIQRQGIQNT